MNATFLHLIFGLGCMFVSHTYLESSYQVPDTLFYQAEFVKDHSTLISFGVCESVAAVHEFVFDKNASGKEDPAGFLRSQVGIVPMVVFWRKEF